MKNKKKILVLGMAAFLTLGLASCGKSSQPVIGGGAGGGNNVPSDYKVITQNSWPKQQITTKIGVDVPEFKGKFSELAVVKESDPDEFTIGMTDVSKEDISAYSQTLLADNYEEKDVGSRYLKITEVGIVTIFTNSNSNVFNITIQIERFTKGKYDSWPLTQINASFSKAGIPELSGATSYDYKSDMFGTSIIAYGVKEATKSNYETALVNAGYEYSNEQKFYAKNVEDTGTFVVSLTWNNHILEIKVMEM